MCVLAAAFLHTDLYETSGPDNTGSRIQSADEVRSPSVPTTFLNHSN